MNTILGYKGIMTNTFVKGTRVPLTLVKSGPCVVIQIKTKDKDGYWAVQIGFGEKKLNRHTKPLKGHLKAAYKDQKKAARFLREIRMDEKPDFKVGDQIMISDVLKKGDVVNVTGTSKGKGFAGVVKRWGFAGGPRTHGQSDRLRAPGSIGQGTTPGRVWKGKKMPGRMGLDTVTVKNLIVVDVDEENGVISLSGPVPGNKNSLLMIKKVASGKLDELVQEAPEIVEQKEPVEEGEKESESSENIKEEVKEEKE